MDAKYKEVETIPEFIDAIRLRVDVFIKEQGCEPGWEPDEDDKTARHFIVVVDGKVVATTRLRETNKSEFKIERMVTKKECRGKGVGKGLLVYLLSEINKLKPKMVWLQSQVKSQKFYEKCGFMPVSEPYDLLGIEHLDMESIK